MYNRLSIYTNYNYATFSYFGIQIFDIDELIKSRKEAAKSKMLNEIRDEAIEIAISKISAAKQTILLEAAEEVDDRKFDSV